MRGDYLMETLFIVLFAIIYISMVIVIAGSCQTGIGSIATIVIGAMLAVPIFYLAVAYVGLLSVFFIGSLVLLGSND